MPRLLQMVFQTVEVGLSRSAFVSTELGPYNAHAVATKRFAPQANHTFGGPRPL